MVRFASDIMESAGSSPFQVHSALLNPGLLRTMQGMLMLGSGIVYFLRNYLK